MFTFIARIDHFLYTKLGIVTPLQKSLRKIESRRIQRLLDNEHARRDYQNKLHKTCYTTKQALMLETPNNI